MIKSGHIDQYKQYSNFKNVRDFNNNIEQWMIDIKSEFTKGELVGLKRLIRYSAKIAGVCNAKIQTLVSACSEMGGISRRTFERMLVKAKTLGIIKVLNTAKGNGKQGHNVYVFQRYQSADISVSTSNDVPVQEKLSEHKNNQSLESSNILNKRNQSLDYTYTSESVPKKFTELVKIHVNVPENWKIIEGLWDRVKIAAYKNSMETHKDTMLDVSISAFKQVIRKSRVTSLKSKYAYFYGILKKKFSDAFNDYCNSLLDEPEDMVG